MHGGDHQGRVQQEIFPWMGVLEKAGRDQWSPLPSKFGKLPAVRVMFHRGQEQQPFRQ